MADKKISALSSATTPLAGTEVLPIVQSGATVKVPVADLTKGRTVSATGVTTEGATNLGLGTNGTTTGVTVTPAGNIGVGVTPSTWLASSFAVQYGLRGSLFNRDSSTRLAQNVYFDVNGAPRYIASGTAEVFLETNRNFYWQTAPSGSADGAITLTERMRLDDAGNLTLNTGNLVVGTAGKGIAFANNTITEDKVSAYKKSASTTIAASAGRSDLYFNVLANQTFTTTAAGFGGLVTITTDDGVAATFFWSWNSATITILATGSALFAATSTPSATEIGIFKSASSSTFSVKNGTASTKAITICLVGDYAASTTDPA